MGSVPQTESPYNHVRVRDLNHDRVAIYARVSSDEQAQAGTIENQIDFARRYCDLHGLLIHDFYTDEGVSGALAVEERPNGRRLLDDARAGKFSAVLVYRVDRFARSTLHLLHAHDVLRQAKVALRSMTEPFDTATPLGEFIMTLLGSLGALERATIIERTNLGRLRAAREGRWLGGKPPYGYRVVDKRLVVEPTEAAIVQRIFRLYVEEGMGLIPIAELLNAEGVASPFGQRGQTTRRWPDGERRWNTGTISRLLHNTAYVGRYQAGRRTGKALAEYATPPIVDQSLFDAAQRLLQERFFEASRNARRLYLLRGFITCSCGRSVVGDGNRKRDQFYYVCPEGHFRHRAEALEAAIWRDLATYARNPEEEVLRPLRQRLRTQAQEVEDVSQELADLARRLGAKKAEQDAVITLYRKGLITEAQFDSLLDALAAEMAALEARQQTLFARQTQAQARETNLLSAEAVLARLRERVDQIERDSASGEPERLAAALQSKRTLFKGLVDGARVAEDGALDITYCFSDSSVHASVRGKPSSVFKLKIRGNA